VEVKVDFQKQKKNNKLEKKKLEEWIKEGFFE